MIAFSQRHQIIPSLEALSNLLDVSLSDERMKFLESYIAKHFSWEQFRGSCRWLSENYEKRTFPVPANFHRGAREYTVGRRNMQGYNEIVWRKEFANILGISVEKLPVHANQLTDEQRERLDLVPRGFKIVFNSKSVETQKMEPVSSDQLPTRQNSRGVRWDFT